MKRPISASWILLLFAGAVAEGCLNPKPDDYPSSLVIDGESNGAGDVPMNNPGTGPATPDSDPGIVDWGDNLEPPVISADHTPRNPRDAGASNDLDPPPDAGDPPIPADGGPPPAVQRAADPR